jgi:hypothetical protein
MDAASLEDASTIGPAWNKFATIGGTGNAYLVTGPGVRNAKPRGGGNAVCPAWRKAVIHASKFIIEARPSKPPTEMPLLNRRNPSQRCSVSTSERHCERGGPGRPQCERTTLEGPGPRYGCLHQRGTSRSQFNKLTPKTLS